MCGIVGLHLKNSELYPRLGELIAPMLDCMSSRGPDSAGLALYQDSADGRGPKMDVYKDVGHPRDVCERYGIAQKSGFQCIGHTRMATESAVTTEASHPFAPTPEMSLVHNGAFSNHATVRRRLADVGITCTTDNDSEVVARFVGWQMSMGADLDEALRMVLKELDGFFTLLVGTTTQFAVIRDSFACKPAVIAETADYVAFSSEYHALAGLPGIGDAAVFEPVPEGVYTWTR